MKKTTTLLLLVMALCSHATELRFSQPVFYVENAEAYAVFNVAWDHAWSNERNHDAIWLFFKLKPSNGPAGHVKVAEVGHQVINVFSEDPGLQFQLADDQVGLFLHPTGDFRGMVHATLKVALDPQSFQQVNMRRASLDVFGVEMVQIPKGSFYAGAPGAKDRLIGELYWSNGDGLIEVSREDQSFEVGRDAGLFYPNQEGYEGDQGGPIPATYPKGVDAFFMMKYELTEGQYVSFLNNLTDTQQAERQLHETPDFNGKIEVGPEGYTTEHPHRPCSFVSWDDAMAFADWAGLRPMTELEYTKAARGPEKPTALDYPWGTEDKARVQRLPDPNENLVMINGMHEGELNDDNKFLFGASHYWVMDLAGGLWERLITLGHPNGRAFTGANGDGVLSEEGKANTSGWPIEEKDSGGIGFRGGGFYGYARDYHHFNPFSPISFRPYGGWHGGMRSIAYGTRFVRTID